MMGTKQVLKGGDEWEAARIITERVHGEYQAYWASLKEELVKDGVLVYAEL